MPDFPPISARALLAAAAVAATASLSALAGGKGMLILQCGSDWCESGEFVHQAFKSPEFRKALGGRFELAVYDDMENPTPKVREANAKLERLRVPSTRFPAITCLTGENRLFAQIENIPFNVTPKSLAETVEAAVKKKAEVEKLFKHGRGRGKSPADALGQGFALLESQVGEFYRHRLRKGPLAWEEQWKHLEEIDADDRFGWRRRFTMGYGFDLVEKATECAKYGDVAKGEKLVASLRAIPTNNLTVVQRQCIEVVEFAFEHGSGSDSVSASEVERFRRILDMGRDTVWGQFALGRLVLAGEDVEPVKPYRAAVRPRPVDAAPLTTPFRLRDIAARVASAQPGKDGFEEARKRDIALYAVLRRIGEEGWDEIKARPGAAGFLRSFFGDRTWMEDFAWSGSCSNWADALLALESLYFQDGGRWISGDGPGRRFATATALEKPTVDEAWLADWLDAYRTTALAKRLHKRALEQPVWQWRYAIRQIHGSREVDDPPNQQRFLDMFYNVSVARFGGALGVVPYRLYNCFGASVHTPKYYEAWVAAGEWPKRRYSYIVGGVCGELSTFASCCSNAHGLPSVPVGQPGHCAFTRRRLDGTWEIDNFISPPTGFSTFWRGGGHWTYTLAVEATFEGEREKRLDANRYLEIAHLAESEEKDAATVNALYRRACNSWPKHYTAWREYGAWLARAGRPVEEHYVYVRAALKALDGWRNPLWDLLTPYFSRVANERGAQALADALVEFAPSLRQGEARLRDEGDFGGVVKRWAKPLEGDAALMERVVLAFTSSQYGTRTFFTQTLGWCAKFVFADESRAKRFLNLLPKFAEKFANSMRGKKGSAKIVAAARKGKPDLGSFIAEAEKSGDVAAFRHFAAMQEKVGAPVTGTRFKDRDFNGVLVSAEGMLSLSKPSPGDNPSLHPRTIDDSPAKEFTFCTEKEDVPWAMVTLAGPCELRGIVLVNRSSNEKLCEQQVPLEVEISEDKSSWTKVFSDDRVRKRYSFEFHFGKYPKARYVRIRRAAITDGKRERKENFRLSKILVYGKKLY